MQVRPIQLPKDIKAFIELPYHFYSNDPMWVAPLRGEQTALFDPKRNPLLEHCDWQLFLLEDCGRAIGRVAAYIDRLAVEAWGEPVGFFGHDECIPEENASRLLLTAAHDRRSNAACNPYAAVDLCLAGMGAGVGRLQPTTGDHGTLQPVLLQPAHA